MDIAPTHRLAFIADTRFGKALSQLKRIVAILAIAATTFALLSIGANAASAAGGGYQQSNVQINLIQMPDGSYETNIGLYNPASNLFERCDPTLCGTLAYQHGAFTILPAPHEKLLGGFLCYRNNGMHYGPCPDVTLKPMARLLTETLATTVNGVTTTKVYHDHVYTLYALLFLKGYPVPTY